MPRWENEDSSQRSQSTPNRIGLVGTGLFELRFHFSRVTLKESNRASGFLTNGLARRTCAAPYAHLGPKFIPLGGVSLANMMTYLNSDLIAAVGGSWLAPREVIRDQDWKKIAQNAREAVVGVRG